VPGNGREDRECAGEKFRNIANVLRRGRVGDEPAGNMTHVTREAYIQGIPRFLIKKPTFLTKKDELLAEKCSIGRDETNSMYSEMT
jgi:hypothetical protein